MCNLLSSAVFDLPVWCVIANNTSTFLHKCLKCLDLRNSMEISNQMLYPSVTRRTKATDLAVSAGIIDTGIVHTTGVNLFVDSCQPSIPRNCGSLFTCCWPVSFAFSSSHESRQLDRRSCSRSTSTGRTAVFQTG